MTRPAAKPMSLPMAREIVANYALYRSRLSADIADWLIAEAWKVLPRPAAPVWPYRQFPEDAA